MMKMGIMELMMCTVFPVAIRRPMVVITETMATIIVFPVFTMPTVIMIPAMLAVVTAIVITTVIVPAIIIIATVVATAIYVGDTIAIDVTLFNVAGAEVVVITRLHKVHRP